MMDYFFFGFLTGAVATILIIGGVIGIVSVGTSIKDTLSRAFGNRCNASLANRNNRSLALYNKRVDEKEVRDLAKRLNVKIGE